MQKYRKISYGICKNKTNCRFMSHIHLFSVEKQYNTRKYALMCIAEQKVCHTKDCIKVITRSQDELPFCPLGVVTKDDEVNQFVLLTH